MRNKSVVENHDKLFVQNILGVPTNPGETNATLMSWFSNYAHRVDGGTLHVRNMRGDQDVLIAARRGNAHRDSGRP